MFGELASLRADVAANCFAIRPERSEQYYPSIPYYGDAQCLAVKGDNTGINTFADLSGKKVGVSSGQASETILGGMSGKYNFELVVYEGLFLGYADVDLGRLDVMGGPVTGVNQYMNVSGQTLRILDEKLTANNVGYYFQKTDNGKALCDEVNKVIQEMLDDGTCGKIVKKYLYEDMTAYIK
jgi:ABC-type amino acid transport substrate-binding protein